MTIGKDLDIGALVLLVYRDWDLDPLHPRSRGHFRKAAAALERQILGRARRNEPPCAEDQLELARTYVRLGKDKRAADRYRVYLAFPGR